MLDFKSKENVNDDSGLFLISISGNDHPGITTKLSKILSEYDVNILDIGQAVIHNTLSMGFLVEINKATDTSPMFKDLLYKSHQLNINIKFDPISIDKYSDWVKERGKNRYIISLISRKINSRDISKVSSIVYENGLNIDYIRRLSGRIPVGEVGNKSPTCVEISVKGHIKDSIKIKKEFIDASSSLNIDIAFQEDNMFRRSRRLVCFDMDSTLIQAEVIDELAKANGAYEKVKEITESAMNGEVDFSESFIRRVSYLKGLSVSHMEKIAKSLPLTEGCEELINTLKFFGYKTAIISGGFDYFGNYLKDKLGIDYVYANSLEVEDGVLTGKHKGLIIDAKMKAHYLEEIAKKEDIHLEQVIAVGDGANDLLMLSKAGLGIAFQAKPIVREQAQNSISTLGLDAILYILGYRDLEMLN